MSSNNDPFIRSLESIGRGLAPQLKLISRIGVLALLLIGVFFAWKTYTKKAEMKAQTALFELEKKFEAPKAQEKQKEPPKIDTTAKIEALKSFAMENKSTKAGIMAAMKASDLLQAEKAHKDALTILTIFTKQKSKDSLIYGLYLLKLAQAHANTNQCDTAISNLNLITGSEKFDFLHAEAHLNTALCQYKLGQLQEAKTLLLKIKSDYPDTVSAMTAERYLRVINLGV